jgi:hypothetical protein
MSLKSTSLLLIVLLGMMGFILWQNFPNVIALAGSSCPFPPEDCHGPATAQTSRKAFEVREKADGDCLGSECWGIDGAFVRRKRWENALKDVAYLPRTQDIVTVQVSHTDDTGALVVFITDSDGRKASFWTKTADGGLVTAITPY